MKLTFVYDTKLVKVNENTFYSVRFTYDTWKRYLAVFDKLVIVTRYINSENQESKYKLSSGNNVIISPIAKPFSLVKTIKHLYYKIKDSDAIIIRLPSFLGVMAFFICEKLKKPFLIEIVGCAWDSLWNHSIRGKFIAPFLYYIMKWIVRKSNYSLYVTDLFLQNRYPTNGKYINCSNVFLNKNIIDLNKKKIEHDSGIIKLGTIGGLHVRFKGYDQVIKMMSKLKKRGINNIEYHLVGEGNADWIKKVAKKNHIEDCVFIHGAMPHNKVLSFLDEIDIYIQPSLQEGMPRALLEAMSKACPCIGSNVGGIPELLDQSVIYRRKNINQLMNIYLHLIKGENIEIQSQKNFYRAMDFLSDNLDIKRKNFLLEFKESAIYNHENCI